MSEIGLHPIPESEPVLHQLQTHFGKLVAEATQRKEALHRFPGTMPLTLSRRHLDMVSKNDYVMLEKSDGTRYMLLAVKEYVLLIDRRFRFYAIDPNPAIMSKGFVDAQENTVLDGELTYNFITQQYDYLIYDAISIDGDLSVAQRGFRERMQAAEVFVAAPRLWAPFCSGLLRLRIKDYYEKKDIRNLFSRLKKKPKGHYLYVNDDRRDGALCNENDGIIFAPVGMPYQVKNCPALLKWKPPALNSIDFLLQLERTVNNRRNNEPSVRAHIAFRGERGNIRLREVYFSSKLRAEWAANFDKYNNSIVELSYDRLAGEWRYIRQREDKDSPNFASTVVDTMETIAESMERDELVRYIESHAASPPEKEADIIATNSKNQACCTFRNDMFDSNNHAYLMTTAISTTKPPRLPPPPPRSHGRGRRRDSGHRGSIANGDQHEDMAGQQDDVERRPFEYTDDV